MLGYVREILHKRDTYEADFVPRLAQDDWIRTITQRSSVLDAGSHRPDGELAATKSPALTALNAARRELKAIRVDISLEEPLGDHLQIIGRDKEIDTTLPRTLRRTDKRGRHWAHEDAQITDRGRCTQPVTARGPCVTQQRCEPFWGV